MPILSAEGIKEGLIAGMTCKQNLLCFGWQVHAKTAFYSHNSELFCPLVVQSLAVESNEKIFFPD